MAQGQTRSSVVSRKLCVVIPVHNRCDITMAGLRSLNEVDTNGLSVQVIVVDDGSTDGTADAIGAEFPRILIVEGDGRLHYAGGTNRGLQAALALDPEFIIAANDDAEFDPMLFRYLVEAADRNPGDVVGALLLRHDEPATVFQVGLHFDVSYGGWHVPSQWAAADLPHGDLQVETLVGNCLLVPTELVRVVGLMDETRFPVGASDVQWVRKMQNLGRRCLVATDARVFCRANKILPPVRTLGINGALRVLFVDQKHPLNLRRQWRALWFSAPSRSSAVAAMAMHILRLVQRSLGFGRWPNWPDPRIPTL